MIHFLTGKIITKGENFAVVENSGIGFKIFLTSDAIRKLPDNDSPVKLFCYLYIREETGLELYGFLKEEELNFFGLLNSISGIGPKTALNILAIDRLENIMAAIIENRPDLLTRASGIGQKTAERVILELKSKIKLKTAKILTQKLDLDTEVEEALVGLGYSRRQVREILSKIPSEMTKIEERLREALRFLSKR
ncbi:MAG: Holliday junction DNA helicase RuvA [Candidatus Yanofskybacteria bacterium RIFCSPHIGHO2_01_FULL_41_26]|uniref:Holliday junction branch migration complex subunit RuvA n=1 Tax=Candidatus Yanofskybacteria bacterium RIFCSPHIGHO2_01_FULL_41_26 TaxID=1802661 RepID=A0A1F8EF44_9BACT|nr:MAG: Holliday junction DNA helicase RuvA [Candidatus Yanofskybacteria bacterium RIFCSPHIGHO2_01_FULL_41_26]